MKYDVTERERQILVEADKLIQFLREVKFEVDSIANKAIEKTIKKYNINVERILHIPNGKDES